MFSTGENEVNLTLDKVLLLIVLAAIAFILLTCAGCMPGFVQDNVECAGVVGGMLEDDERLPTDTRGLGTALRDTSDATSDTIGRSGKIINRGNIKKRLGEVKIGAETYVPWYNQIPSTGIPWLDALVGLLSTGAGAYFLRKPLRRGLHLLTHNAKGGGDEKVAQ